MNRNKPDPVTAAAEMLEIVQVRRAAATSDLGEAIARRRAAALPAALGDDMAERSRAIAAAEVSALQDLLVDLAEAEDQARAALSSANARAAADTATRRRQELAARLAPIFKANPALARGAIDKIQVAVEWLDTRQRLPAPDKSKTIGFLEGEIRYHTGKSVDAGEILAAALLLGIQYQPSGSGLIYGSIAVDPYRLKSNQLPAPEQGEPAFVRMHPSSPVGGRAA